jgi:hypothetical protein
LVTLDNKVQEMGDKPTSQDKPFYFEWHFNFKQTLAIDLSIESGEEDTVSGTREQENTVAVSKKKQKSSTPIVQESEGQNIGKFIKLETPPIIFGTSKYRPRLCGLSHFFQVNF